MTKKTIMEYSDFKNPYLKVTVFDGKGEKSELVIKFSEYEIDGGEIIAPDTVVLRIKEAFERIYPVELLLSCDEIYKSVFSFPKMSRFRAEAAYRKQLKNMQRDDYTVIEDFYAHSVGCVFNSYFVPNKIVNCLKKIVRDLGSRVEKVRLFGMYLKEQLNYKKDYVYFYIREHLCRMLLVVENRLVTEYDFSFDNVDEIQRRFLMVISKHEFEFECKKISFYGVDSDIPLELNLGLRRVDAEDIPVLPDDIEIEYDDPLDEMANTKPTTFEQRLAESPEYVKKRYQKLADTILAYRDMECMANDVCATFFAQSKIWFKIDIDKKGEGKRISLYIADDPQNFAKRKVQFAISKKQNFLSTPCLIRISTNSRFALAMQIIRKFMAENQIPLAGKDNLKEKLLRQAERIKQINARKEAQKEKELEEKQAAESEQPANENVVAASPENQSVDKTNQPAENAAEDAESAQEFSVPNSELPPESESVATTAAEHDAPSQENFEESNTSDEAAKATSPKNNNVDKTKKEKRGFFGLFKSNKKKDEPQNGEKDLAKNDIESTDVESKNSDVKSKTKPTKKKKQSSKEDKQQSTKNVKSQPQEEKSKQVEKSKEKQKSSKSQTKPADQKAKQAQLAKQQRERAQREKVQQTLKAKNEKTQAALKAHKEAKKKK